MFMETSAMTGECVEEAFMKCARSVLSKIESGVIDPKTMVGRGVEQMDNTEEAETVAPSRCWC